MSERHPSNKLQVSLDEISREDLAELVEHTGVKASRIVREGISLLAWIARKHREGNTVTFAVDPEGKRYDYYLNVIVAQSHKRPAKNTLDQEQATPHPKIN